MSSLTTMQGLALAGDGGSEAPSSLFFGTTKIRRGGLVVVGRKLVTLSTLWVGLSKI